MKLKTGIYAGAMLAGLIGMAGCSLTSTVEKNRLTLCYGNDNGASCPSGMREVDGKELLKQVPYVGGIAGGIAEAKQTCVSYSDTNITCADGQKQIIIDLIKEKE